MLSHACYNIYDYYYDYNHTPYVYLPYYIMWCSGGGGWDGGGAALVLWAVGRIGAILCLQVRKGSAITWSYGLTEHYANI